MASQMIATKGNLIQAKKTLTLSATGFELLDRKRNILVREMMQLLGQDKELRTQISDSYRAAYLALQRANITLGFVEGLAESVPLDNQVNIRFRSVMGVDIPIVDYTAPAMELHYGYIRSNSALDEAQLCFLRVKEKTALLAEVESSAFRLAEAIIKTQRRANALKNVMIPQLQETVRSITESLDEKDREEFSRMKVIKQTQQT